MQDQGVPEFLAPTWTFEPPKPRPARAGSKDARAKGRATGCYVPPRAQTRCAGDMQSLAIVGHRRAPSGEPAAEKWVKLFRVSTTPNHMEQNSRPTGVPHALTRHGDLQSLVIRGRGSGQVATDSDSSTLRSVSKMPGIPPGSRPFYGRAAATRVISMLDREIHHLYSPPASWDSNFESVDAGDWAGYRAPAVSVTFYGPARSGPSGLTVVILVLLALTAAWLLGATAAFAFGGA